MANESKLGRIVTTFVFKEEPRKELGEQRSSAMEQRSFEGFFPLDKKDSVYFGYPQETPKRERKIRDGHYEGSQLEVTYYLEWIKDHPGNIKE